MILFLLPQKTKVTRSGQTLDGCNFSDYMVKVKALPSPNRTCFTINITVSERTKKLDPRFYCGDLKKTFKTKTKAIEHFMREKNPFNS